jgi:hypothetical protein
VYRHRRDHFDFSNPRRGPRLTSYGHPSRVCGPGDRGHARASGGRRRGAGGGCGRGKSLPRHLPCGPGWEGGESWTRCRAISFRESASATKGKPRGHRGGTPLGAGSAMIEERCPLVRPGSSIAASSCPGSYHQQHRRSSAPLGLLAPLLLGISDIAPARDGGRSDYGTSQRVDHLMGCPLRRIDTGEGGMGGRRRCGCSGCRGWR